MSGQLWACHGPLQAQVQPLQCATGVVELLLVGYFGQAGQVVCGWYSFAECLSFQDVVEALLGNHSAQSPASM